MTIPTELVPELSLVVPVKNRANEIGSSFERLAEVLADSCRTWEVIAVDDASDDGSLEALRRATENQPQFRILMQPDSRGRARTIGRGFDAARHMVVAMADVAVDLPVSFLLDAWSQLRTADVVASTWARHRSIGDSLAWRMARRSLSRSFGIQPAGDGAGPMVLRRSAAEVLSPSGPDLTVGLELLARAERAGLRWTEIELDSDPMPVGYQPPPPRALARAARTLRPEFA